MNRDELIANVQTIVVLIMENRSFDHVLGQLRHPKFGNRTDVEGIADLDNPDYVNADNDGVGVSPFWRPDAPFPSDVPHNRGSVAQQMAFSSLTRSFQMTGFVRAFEDSFHTSIDKSPPMGLMMPQDLPATSALAAQYTVCDNWFACVPTSTAPNRLMSMCGSTNIAETSTLLPDQTTVYDWLLAHGVRWRVYSAGLPFFLLMPRLAPLMLTSHFRRFDELKNDLAADLPDQRPQVIFIEPDYFCCPVHLRPPCDNHAPLGMQPGEQFLREVYGVLASDGGWGHTVFIATYDEHGGFFDHVAPPVVPYRNPNGISFDSAGPRVPAIVAGPFAPQGVAKNQLDNTSILQLLAERFGKSGESYSAEVHGRSLHGVQSVSAVLSATAANTAVAPIAPVSVIASAPGILGPLRPLFVAAIQNLLRQHGGEALAKYPELSALEK
ncbi:MAG TPA: alkaline phosphatase family protein [Polyangiaceae bacterium]|jgi:phospholipase C|nr:alkaline phosphatase family protein [Polyangiaceae bacterium]